jgi:Ca2+-binding EF-hand superfamily protein
MSDEGITSDEMNRCNQEFEKLTKRDDEKERNYLTYDELKEVLEIVLGYKFKRDNSFFKMVSELDLLEPNKVYFMDFISIYKK